MPMNIPLYTSQQAVNHIKLQESNMDKLREQDELDELLAEKEEDKLDVEYEYFFARNFFQLWNEGDE